jgi:hypothetical protein
MNEKTISTHNGSIVHRDHNIRNYILGQLPANIYPERTKFNEVLIDETPQHAYKRIFGQALQEYNDKQTRPERKIRSYYSHIKKSAKQHPLYEMIIQIGDYKDTGTVNIDNEKACIKEFIAGWKTRNPNLELIGAYIHADEMTLHAHLDYVCVGHNYSKGMRMQAGMVKALEEQGFVKEGKETAQIKWERRENKELERICIAHAIAVRHPEGEKTEHLRTEEYKLRKEIEEASCHISEATAELNSLVEQAKTLNSEKEKLIGEVLTLKEVQELETGKDFFGRKKNFINLPYDKYIKMKRTCEKLGLFDRDKAEFQIYKKQQQEMLKKQKQDLKMLKINLFEKQEQTYKYEDFWRSFYLNIKLVGKIFKKYLRKK